MGRAEPDGQRRLGRRRRTGRRVRLSASPVCGARSWMSSVTHLVIEALTWNWAGLSRWTVHRSRASAARKLNVITMTVAKSPDLQNTQLYVVLGGLWLYPAPPTAYRRVRLPRPLREPSPCPRAMADAARVAGVVVVGSMDARSPVRHTKPGPRCRRYPPWAVQLGLAGSSYRYLVGDRCSWAGVQSHQTCNRPPDNWYSPLALVHCTPSTTTRSVCA
jgi:hypothetical protein